MNSIRLTEILNKLSKQQATTNFILNRVLSKIEVMEANSKINHTSVSQNMEEELDEIFLASFPIKNEDEFSSVELQLQNDKKFVAKLVNNLIHHTK